eukprot:2438319-Pyramimonas_sp.AAC.1
MRPLQSRAQLGGGPAAGARRRPRAPLRNKGLRQSCRQGHGASCGAGQKFETRTFDDGPTALPS